MRTYRDESDIGCVHIVFDRHDPIEVVVAGPVIVDGVLAESCVITIDGADFVDRINVTHITPPNTKRY